MVRSLFFTLALLVSHAAWAVSVHLQADTTQLQVGQTVSLTLTLIDGVPDALPTIESQDGLQIRFSGQRQGTNIVNFQVTRYVQLTYQVTAMAEGDFTLPPVSLKIDGKTETTQAIQLRVSPRPLEAISQLSATAQFTQTEVWEGQVVIFEYELRSRVNVLQSQWTLPDFNGLIAPREGDRPRRKHQIKDEEQIVAIDRSSLPFIAATVGTLDQPASLVRLDIALAGQERRRDPFSLFTQTKREALTTLPAPLLVKRRPKEPTDFSGMVGDFQFSLSPIPQTVSVGDSINLTVIATGDGSLEGVKSPTLKPTDQARIYSSSPVISARVQNGRYHSTGEFTQVIVPTMPGPLALGALQFSSFSPSRGEYVTHTLKLPTLTVNAGREADSTLQSFSDQAATPSAVQAPQDIRPLWTTGGGHARRFDRVTPIAALIGGLPGLLLLLQAGALSWRRRRPVKAVAPPSLTRRLEQLSADPAERLSTLDALLRGLDQSALSPEERRSLEGLQAQLSRLRFGRSTDDSALVQAIIHFIQQQERR